jgi:hypothetical protein
MFRLMAPSSPSLAASTSRKDSLVTLRAASAPSAANTMLPGRNATR